MTRSAAGRSAALGGVLRVVAACLALTACSGAAPAQMQEQPDDTTALSAQPLAPPAEMSPTASQRQGPVSRPADSEDAGLSPPEPNPEPSEALDSVGEGFGALGLVAAGVSDSARKVLGVFDSAREVLAAFWRIAWKFRDLLMPLVGSWLLLRIARLFVLAPDRGRQRRPARRSQMLALEPPEPSGPPTIDRLIRRGVGTTTEGTEFCYQTAGGSEFELRLSETPPTEWRTYILKQPGYRGRDTDSQATHRYLDPVGLPYVCWSAPLRTPKEAHTVARLWAEATEHYIATGQFLAPRDLPDADPEPGTPLAELLDGPAAAAA